MLLGLLPGLQSSADALADAHLVGLDPGVQLGLLLWLAVLPSAAALAEAHLLGLKQDPAGTASESCLLVGRLTGDCCDGIGAFIILDKYCLTVAGWDANPEETLWGVHCCSPGCRLTPTAWSGIPTKCAASPSLGLGKSWESAQHWGWEDPQVEGWDSPCWCLGFWVGPGACASTARVWRPVESQCWGEDVGLG